MRSLIKRYYNKFTYPYFVTLLLQACQGDFDECAEILLNHKADPNLVDKDGNTALHLAADSGFVHVAILLLNSGAMATPTNKVRY